MNNVETKGRHIECTNAEYHARDEWSRSQHVDLLESPPLFEGKHITHIYPPEKKKVWDTGTVAHTCLLEPGGVDSVVRIIPREALNANGHRKGSEWKQWKEENADFIDMKPDEFEGVRQMVVNVHAHPVAAMLLKNAIHFEYTIVWQDEETGLLLRARLDMVCRHLDGVVISEFKTTRAILARAFASDAARYRYYCQEAMYREAGEAMGWKVYGFPFICGDKSPAYQCEVRTLPGRALELGREVIHSTRRDLAHRLKTGDWHAPTWGTAQEIDLPEWTYHQDQWRI